MSADDLRGLRIAVTRPRDRAEAFARSLKKNGAEEVHVEKD